MKKVGIITIESLNYGNRLQNYALQQVVKKLGYDVETIKRSLPQSNKEQIKYIIKSAVQDMMASKGSKFRAFDRLIYHSKSYATNQEISKELALDYDFFIAGSDQIWNPYYDFVGEIEWLTFAKTGQKIAYAGSFGVPELPSTRIEEYKNWINQMDYISVREEAGANIVKELTGKEVSVVLDPTLLLSSDEWRLVERKPSGCPNDDYILVYYVESMSNQMKEAVESARKRGIRVIDARQKLDNGHEWAIGPSEFLYLIDHASMIYTDSFHGTVFAILFHKEFQIFHRDGINMNSRIETLLGILGINDVINFESSENRLIDERNKSLEFLKKALEG